MVFRYADNVMSFRRRKRRGRGGLAGARRRRGRGVYRGTRRQAGRGWLTDWIKRKTDQYVGKKYVPKSLQKVYKAGLDLI